MKKVGFIIKTGREVNGKRYEYFHLRRSDRLNKKKIDTTLYNFGNKEKALSRLKEWENDISKLPTELKEWGYNLEDVAKWKNDIESK